MNRWTRYGLSCFVALAALGAGFATHLTAATPSAVAPDQVSKFLATALPDTQNKTHTLDEWKGKVRVINFWATWCPPCRKEIPHFVDAQKTWSSKGVQFIGVALDNQADVSRFIPQFKINYPILLAEEQGPLLMQNLGNYAGALPFTLVVDGQGKVLQRYAGAVEPALLNQWLKAAQATR